MSLPVTIPTERASIAASLECAESTLVRHIKPLNDPANEFLLATNPMLPPVESGVLKTNLDTLQNADAVTKCFKIARHKLIKNQVSNSTEQTLATLIKRYSKKQKHKMRDKREANLAYSQLCVGLSKAVYGNAHSWRRLLRDMRVNHDILAKHATDYLRKLQAKCNANAAVMNEFKASFDELQEAIDFFNKRQSKFDPKEAFDTSDKVGQGIAATSKRVNIIFACYARAMLDRMREIMKSQRRNIILATHDSEAGLNDEFVVFAEAYKPKNWACNDFSEWDAHFRHIMARMTRDLIVAVGCPVPLADWLLRYREEWIMTYRSSCGTTKLRGSEKQFSGNPFTIAENTICNLALCFALFDYKNVTGGLFKGDDSAVACDDCTLTTQGASLLRQLGHGLKLHHGPVGEFAGWFLTNDGFFPDVVRYAAKFIDKNYRDEKHFEEARSSLRERLSAVKTQAQCAYGVAMCHHYYNRVFNTNITVGEIENLYAFLLSSRDMPFSTLVPVSLPNLNSN